LSSKVNVEVCPPPEAKRYLPLLTPSPPEEGEENK